MVDYDLFRETLAASLLDCAGRRRQAVDGVASGEDLKIIALFERLAASAETLDFRVFRRVQSMLSHEGLAYRFEEQQDSLFHYVGVFCWPRDATELVLSMLHRASAQAPVECGPSAVRGGQTGSSQARRSEQVRSLEGVPPDGLASTWARDLSAGFAIMGPMLAIWTVQLGVCQVHDHALIGARPAVPATVISMTPLTGGRSTNSATTLALQFQPAPSASPCRVTIRLDSPGIDVALGQTMLVVPRSAECEAPLLPVRIGDPQQSFALAVAFLLGGLLSLKAWSWLSKPHRPALTRPAWS